MPLLRVLTSQYGLSAIMQWSFTELCQNVFCLKYYLMTQDRILNVHFYMSVTMCYELLQKMWSRSASVQQENQLAFWVRDNHLLLAT